MAWLGLFGKTKSVDVDDVIVETREQRIPAGPTPSPIHPEIPGFSYRPEWLQVKSYIEKQLEIHRGYLESPGMPHEETEGHRYAIMELKGLLNLAKPSKMQPTGSEN